jgi:arsenite methyltransferase
MITDDDRWSAWLGRERSGADAMRAEAIRTETRAVAERVLRRLPHAVNATVMDVGCGEGLVGLAALERPGVQVVFSDVSAVLVERARTAVAAYGALDRAQFVVADAASLASHADGSVDAVVTRASLAYVADKKAAFAAAHRVLRPGGTLSIAEPVFRDTAFRLTTMRRALAGADPDLALLHRWHALALPDTVEGLRAHPLTNFDERNLLWFATAAGFVDVHVRLHLDSFAFVAMSWETALATALLPGTPTLGAALAEHYTADERARFELRFRPLFENGGFPAEVRATAYLWATRPVHESGDSRPFVPTASRASISA